MERMFEGKSSEAGAPEQPAPWRRIERLGRDGRVLDYVEVGQCGACGRGVDRAFPEWRVVDGALVCLECAPAPATASQRVPAFLRVRSSQGQPA